MPTTAVNDASNERSLAEENAALKSRVAELTAERNTLFKAYEELLTKYKLQQHQLYVAKAERLNIHQLEIEFAKTEAELQKMKESLGVVDDEPKPKPDGRNKPRPNRPGVGRRDLSEIELPEDRIEITDPSLEGKCERIGFEESTRLGYRRPSRVRIVVAIAKYKIEKDGAVEYVRAERPREIVSRGLLAPSMISHLLVSKYLMGLPYFRLEEQASRDGVPLDRSTMCRYGDEIGGALGTIVEAARAEAMKSAFCLSTDATGICIQPEPLPDRARQACRKGHFFVVLADRDHVFFEYQSKHDSKAVCEMFRGYTGYLQADAHAIYNALYRGEANTGVDPPLSAPTEVACWAHARRKFWEAAMSKHAIGGEGALRISKLFAIDASWSKEPPQRRTELRRLKLTPLVNEFFQWAEREFEHVKHDRGVVCTALGYAVRQRAALSTFLSDGRLRMDNNLSEGALRSIAVGRKAWLFFGSDDHASSAANILSLIASCKLHDLDPELYLTEIIRVHPQWPLERHIELAPRYWAQTRARLDPDELKKELGPITIPPPREMNP